MTPANDNATPSLSCEINGRPVEIYQTSYGAWTYRSGHWSSWGFIKGDEFATAVGAQQDAVERLNG